MSPITAGTATASYDDVVAENTELKTEIEKYKDQ